MFARSTGWIPAPSPEIFEYVTDPSGWDRWWSLATANGPAPLARVGDSCEGVWTWRGSSTPVVWRVTRRLRNIIELSATNELRLVARPTLSVAPWQGGSVFELRVDARGSAGQERRLARTVRRDTARLTAVWRGSAPDACTNVLHRGVVVPHEA